tara:strand:- start:131 stop:652 length:522 start_codon:yes stop_codon:yes gene_type:complete
MNQQMPKFKEEKITSPIDGSKNCYRVYTEPITEDYFLCLSTGFMTTTYYKKDSEQLKQVMSQNPKIVQSLQQCDEETGLVWFPVFLNMGDMGMIYPEGNETQWFWKFAKVIDIPKEEQKNYAVPGKDGEFYETKLDVDNASTYPSSDFLGACFDMGIITDKDGESISHLFGRG